MVLMSYQMLARARQSTWRSSGPSTGINAAKVVDAAL
jgi:hypothetical protein